MASSASSSNLSALNALLASPVRAGELKWIGLRPFRRAPLIVVPSATLIAGKGIEGDHFQTRSNGARQVTLIALEDIAAIASFLGMNSVDPQLLRRNLVAAGINLIALKGKRFRIGNAILEASGDCAPCNRMQENLGSSGYNAMRGRGGITARVVEGATISVGDVIEPTAADAQQQL